MLHVQKKKKKEPKEHVPEGVHVWNLTKTLNYYYKYFQRNKRKYIFRIKEKFENNVSPNGKYQ